MNAGYQIVEPKRHLAAGMARSADGGFAILPSAPLTNSHLYLSLG